MAVGCLQGRWWRHTETDVIRTYIGWYHSRWEDSPRWESTATKVQMEQSRASPSNNHSVTTEDKVALPPVSQRRAIRQTMAGWDRALGRGSQESNIPKSKGSLGFDLQPGTVPFHHYTPGSPRFPGTLGNAILPWRYNLSRHVSVQTTAEREL